MPAALRISNLSVHYGETRALQDCSFDVQDGEVFGLLGSNGAGKSTLMKVVSGLVRPGKGSVEVFGNDLELNRGLLKQLLGIVPQDPSFARDFTVSENLRFIAKLYDLKGKELDARLSSCLSDFQLESRRFQRAGTLSGGYQRLLNFALSTLHQPRLLLLDEPTVGLDPEIREMLWGMIRRLRSEGRTLLISTHYLSEATSLCDRIAIISKGRILVLGTPSDIIEQFGGDTTLFLNLSQSPSPLLPEVGKIKGVVSASARGNVLVAACPNKDVVRIMAALHKLIEREKWAVHATYVQEATLDDAFKAIIARQGGGDRP